MQKQTILNLLNSYLAGSEALKRVINSPCVDKVGGKILTFDGTKAIDSPRFGRGGRRNPYNNRGRGNNNRNDSGNDNKGGNRKKSKNGQNQRKSSENVSILF